MKSLVQKLLKIRVKPYYLFQMDLVRGTYHFRTRIETGSRSSNLLSDIPQDSLCLAILSTHPVGVAKIPIHPDYIQRIEKDSIILRNYEGRTYTYPQIPLSDETGQRKTLTPIRETE